MLSYQQMMERLVESQTALMTSYLQTGSMGSVTPAMSFALPAVNVSDMYAPRIYARSDMGRVTIAPR